MGCRARPVELWKLLTPLTRAGVWPWILLAAALCPLPKDGKLLGLPTLCAFRLLTGVPCPGCGMTRSLVCCAHGHFSDALAFHPLGPALFVLLLGACGLRLVRLKWPDALPALTAARLSWLWIGLSIALLLLWPARLLGWLR